MPKKQQDKPGVASHSQEKSKVKTTLHLRLTYEDWKKCFKTLTRAELGIFLAIRTLDPYGDRALEIDCSALGKELELHRTSVSRALYVLVKKGFLDSKYAQVIIRDNIEHQIRVDALRLVARHRLKTELGGQGEVITTVGRIDLLTDTEIIEIKDISNWKGALGQILAYAAFFPNHTKRIHLFGKQDLAKLALAQATCSEFGIAVTFEEVQ